MLDPTRPTRPRRHLVAALSAGLLATGVLAPASAHGAGPGGEDERVDLAAPTITVTRPAGDHHGWYAHPVDLRIQLVDTARPGQIATGVNHVDSEAVLSLAESRTVRLSSLDQTIHFAAEGSTKVDVHAFDVAGNAAHQEHWVGVDRTDPTITFLTPYDGASFRRGDDATVRYSCGDTGSQIRSCTGTLPDGSTLDTSEPGYYTLTVDATDNVDNEHSRTIGWTVLPQAADEFVIGTAPVIEGDPRVGQVLTRTALSFLPAPDTITHQWYRDGVPIRGATAPTYRLVPADLDAQVTYGGTAVRTDYQSREALTPPVRVLGTDVRAASTPTIAGDAVVGGTLTATPATFTPEPTTLRHVWLRNGTVVPGADQATYRLTAADAGAAIRYETHATVDGRAWAQGTSTEVRVRAARLAATGAATLRGDLRVGSVLTAAAPSFSGLPAGAQATLTHEWLRNGQPIAGANAATYRLGAQDVRRQIAVRITAAYPAHESASVTSASSTPVTKARPTVRATVKRSGAAVRLRVLVRAAGVPASALRGKVVVRRGPAVVARTTLVRGKATVRLKGKAATAYRVTFAGSAALAAKTVTVRVRSR